MKLNSNKTHSITVSRSITALPQHPPLFLCGVELETFIFLKVLGIVLDKKLTFETHICNIGQKTGLIRKFFKALRNDDSVLRSFYAFILPCFDYCLHVWCSGSDSHLRLLDCAFGHIRFLLFDLSVDLEDRRKIVSLVLLYKILNNIDYPLHCKLPQFAVPTRTS